MDTIFIMDNMNCRCCQIGIKTSDPCVRLNPCGCSLCCSCMVTFLAQTRLQNPLTCPGGCKTAVKSHSLHRLAAAVQALPPGIAAGSATGEPNNNKLMVVEHHYDSFAMPLLYSQVNEHNYAANDPKMNRAVGARFAVPTLSLFDALKIGGYDYPNDSDPNQKDRELVTLQERKNQLSHRLVQLAHENSLVAMTGAGGRSSRNVGDPRMNGAVAARLADPTVPLFDALRIGGFEYDEMNSDPGQKDKESVPLRTRKSQLCRRLKQAKERLALQRQKHQEALQKDGIVGGAGFPVVRLGGASVLAAAAETEPLKINWTEKCRTPNKRKATHKRFPEYFREIEAFKKEFGHLKVRDRGKNDRESVLGEWINAVRRGAYKVTAEQRKQLDGLGFDWETMSNKRKRDWKEKLKDLTEYSRKFGTTRVGTKYEDSSLYEWVRSQRKNYKKRKMPPERIVALEAIGFEWAPTGAPAMPPCVVPPGIVPPPPGHTGAPTETVQGV